MVSGQNKKSFKLNIVYSALYTMLNIGFPVLTFAYIARIMGPDLLGRLNFTSSYTAIFLLAASLAMPMYGAREIALARDNREILNSTFSELFTLNAITTVLSAGVFGLFFLFSDRMRGDWVLFLIFGMSILFNGVAVDWFFQGLEDYRFILWRNLFFKILSLALIFALVRSREDFLVVAAISVFANAGNNVVGFLAAVKRVKIGLRPWRHIKRHLASMGIASGSTMAASTYVYLDSVLLGYFAGNTSVGLFTSATRPIKLSIALVQSLTSAIMPRFSWYRGQGRLEEYRAMARKSLSLIYMLSFPIAGYLLALSAPIIRMLSGPGFEAAVPTMVISAPLVLLMGFTNFLGLQIIFPDKGEKKLLLATSLSAAVCIALNVLLIPRFAHNGTAAALIAAECCSALILAFLARKHGLGFGFFDLVFLRYLALSAAASGIVYLVSLYIASDFVAILLSCTAGSVFYCLGLLLTRDPMAWEIVGLAGKRARALKNGPS